MALYLAKIRREIEKEERAKALEEEQRAKALQAVMNANEDRNEDGNEDGNENPYVDERRGLAAAVNEGCKRDRIERQIRKRLEARPTRANGRR